MCGTCGDPYEGERHHEAGGKYATGIMVRHYPANTTQIKVSIELTFFHRGYFEFRVCANNNINRTVEPMCLDENLLQIVGNNHTRYYPTAFGTYNLTLQLPVDLHCDQCVLQWKYRGSNFLGVCEDGQESLGCGHQVEYYNCADIAIDSPFPEKRNSTPKTHMETIISRRGHIHHGERSVSNALPTKLFTIITNQKPSVQNQGSSVALTNTPVDQVTGSPGFDCSNSSSNLTTASPFHDLQVNPCTEADTNTLKYRGAGITALQYTDADSNRTMPVSRKKTLDSKMNEETKYAMTRATTSSNDTDKTSNTLISVSTSVTFSNTVDNNVTSINIHETNAKLLNDSVQLECLPGKICPPSRLLCVKRMNCTISLGGSYFCIPIWDCPSSSSQLHNLSRCFGPEKYLKCQGRGIYRHFKSISTWCEDQCANNACQLVVCNCQCYNNVKKQECHATGIFQTVPGSDVWCRINCAQNFCPDTHCTCY